MPSQVISLRVSTDLLTTLLSHLIASEAPLPLSKADLIRTCLRDYCRYLSLPITPATPSSLLTLNTLGRPRTSTFGSLPPAASQPSFADFSAACLSISPTTPASAILATYRELYPDGEAQPAGAKAGAKAPLDAATSASITKLLPILAADSAFSRQTIEELAANYITYHPTDTYASTLEAIRTYCLSHSIPFTSSLGGEDTAPLGAANGGPSDLPNSPDKATI